MTRRLRFDVFGRLIIEIERAGDKWRSYIKDSGGKRRDGPFVPRAVTEADLAGYLADLYHEFARPDRPDVHRLD